MKGFVLCIALCTLAVTQAERDWSTIKSRVNPAFKLFDSNHESRIVGGEEATPNQFPYQVALFLTAPGGTFFCGGSLISRKFVLTAAHCVDSASSAEVLLGAHNVREEESTQKSYNSTKFVVHEKWNRLTLRNDIALIELPEEVELNDVIQLIALPKHSDVGNTFADELATASGWGKDSDKSNAISSVLRFVESTVMHNEKCNKYYFGVIQDTHICTSGKGGKSTCSGDSGGPLVVENTQIGTVSFGIAFGCEIGFPAAFTRTSSYLDWIAANSDVIIH